MAASSVRRGVIVAQEVQNAMNREQPQLGGNRVAKARRLLSRIGIRNDDVAQIGSQFRGHF